MPDAVIVANVNLDLVQVEVAPQRKERLELFVFARLLLWLVNGLVVAASSSASTITTEMLAGLVWSIVVSSWPYPVQYRFNWQDVMIKLNVSISHVMLCIDFYFGKVFPLNEGIFFLK